MILDPGPELRGARRPRGASGSHGHHPSPFPRTLGPSESPLTRTGRALARSPTEQGGRQHTGRPQGQSSDKDDRRVRGRRPAGASEAPERSGPDWNSSLRGTRLCGSPASNLPSEGGGPQGGPLPGRRCQRVAEELRRPPLLPGAGAGWDCRAPPELWAKANITNNRCAPECGAICS